MIWINKFLERVLNHSFEKRSLRRSFFLVQLFHINLCVVKIDGNHNLLKIAFKIKLILSDLTQIKHLKMLKRLRNCNSAFLKLQTISKSGLTQLNQ